MPRKEVLQAMEALEQESTSLPVALDALDDLEDYLNLEDPETLRRLDQVMRRSPGPLANAIERCLLRVRRENVDWDVFTTTAATGHGPPGVSRVLRQAKQSLTADIPFARMAFIERTMAEENFAVGPVLAVQARVEKDVSVIAPMARALGRLGGPTSLATLKVLIGHPAPEVRAAAAEGLGYQRGTQALELIVEALGDPEREVRFQALEVLESSSPRAALAALHSVPVTSPGQVQAVTYLQGLGDYPGATDILLQRLEAPIPALAEECLVALASLRHPVAEKHLEKLSVSRDPADQQTFARASRAWPR